MICLFLFLMLMWRYGYIREREKKEREKREREGEGLGKRDRRKRRERYEEGRVIVCFKIMDIRLRDILIIFVGCICIYELKFSSLVVN